MFNFKKSLTNLTLIVTVCFLALTFNDQIIDAANTTEEAIKEAPSGIDISKYFTHGTSDNSVFTTNSATIVTGHPDVMDLASGKASEGAYWSNMDNKNYIDLTDTKSTQTISAWLYFGDASGSEQINGEGIAFVMQNDPKKTNALGAGYEGLGVYGNDIATQYWDNNIITSSVKEYKYPSTYTPASIASTAIQKSIAIEFDSEKSSPYSYSMLNKPVGDVYNGGSLFLPTKNQDYSMNTFDLSGTNKPINTTLPNYALAKLGAGGGNGHIAFTYPGLADSYVKVPTQQDTTFPNGFTMAHINENESASLTDDADNQNRPIQWHHVTIKWVPNTDGTATLKYSFNDINPNDLTPNTRTGQKSFNRVDSSINVNYKSLFGSDATKVYWGMTGASSSDGSTEDKLVDFESIPALLSIDTDSSLIDHTLNDKIIKPKVSDSDDTDRYVADGDSLSLKYQLSYNAGREAWKTVNPVINLPSYFTADTNNLGTITYMSGTNGTGSVVKTETISASDLNNTKVTIPTLDSAGTGLLGDSNSNLPQSMIVTINGKATNDTSNDVTVTPVASRFTGTNEISDISSPEFIIRHKQTRKLQLTPQTKSIDLPYNHQNAGLVLPTTLTYDDGSKFIDSSNNGSLYYQVKVGGKTFKSDYTPDADTSVTNNIDLKSAILGDNTDQSAFWDIFKANTTQTVTVSVTDQDGVTSNTATYTVNVLPDKTLSVTADPIQFQDTQAVKETKILKRKNSPKVTVKSYNSPWILYAEGTNLTNTNNDKFNGNLVYKSSDSAKSQDLYDQSIYIGQDNSSTTTTVSKVISNSWDTNSGVLLNKSGLSVKGSYTGEITWSAINSI